MEAVHPKERHFWSQRGGIFLFHWDVYGSDGIREGRCSRQNYWWNWPGLVQLLEGFLILFLPKIELFRSILGFESLDDIENVFSLNVLAFIYSLFHGSALGYLLSSKLSISIDFSSGTKMRIQQGRIPQGRGIHLMEENSLRIKTRENIGLESCWREKQFFGKVPFHMKGEEEWLEGKWMHT